MDALASSNVTGEEQQDQSSFGIKKIVDCKIGEGGKQMFKVKWQPTWEPAENLVSCQHLINEFWSFINKAKTNEEVVQQHRKRIRLEQENNVMSVVENFDRISDNDKSDVQRLIARANATSVGSLMSPSDLLMSSPQQRNQKNNLMDMARTPTHSNKVPHSPQTPQNMRLNNPAALQSSGTTGQKSLNFGSPQQVCGDQLQNFSSPGQKGKIGAFGNKGNAHPSPIKVEGNDCKISMNDDSKGVLDPSKLISNTGLKYLENFENQYVKILLACKVCNKEQSLKYPATWKRHFLTHAAKEDLPHKCTFCGKGFVTSTNLKNHTKTHLKAGRGNHHPAPTGVKDEDPWFENTMQQY